MIRVTLPAHLRKLAQVDGEVSSTSTGAGTLGAILDALGGRYPMLRGNDPRSRDTKAPSVRALFRLRGGSVPRSRRTRRLPDAVAKGAEPFMIVGAIAGG